jgi:hypothetical protein
MLITGVIDRAHAAELLLPATQADVRTSLQRDTGTGKLALQTRVVRVDRAALAQHVAPLGIDTAPNRIQRARALDGVITIMLFPGTAATFHRTDVDAIGDSGYSWSGRAEGDAAGSASLIVDVGQVTGHIQLGRRTFRIVPIADAVHRVIEIDPSRFPPD